MSSLEYPAQLLKYLKMYQDNPRSRIFAPLAECYRKIGQVDEAIEICKEGLELNPDFIGGKVALARSYFDKKKYVEVRELLLAVIQAIPDNIIAQKLLADSCVQLGYLEEALAAYKMLLYFNPHDHEVASLIQEIETENYQKFGILKGKTSVYQRPEKVRKLIKLQGLLEKFHRAYTTV